MLKRLIFLLPLFIFLQLQPLAGQTPLADDFDQWVLDGMAQWEIPGLAVAIVKDDEVVYANGFGVRKLGEDAPVDEHTLFGIASVSKNMTAASVALLVDEGYLDWDDRVVDILPWFELSDPWVTQEIRIRDLLTHRVGVGRMLGNRIQFMTNQPREELIYRMRYHDFEQPFRHGYVYSNVMYMVAGEVVAAVSGMSWDQFMKERLFDLTGMERANTSVLDIGDNENAAWPHQYIKGEVQTIQRRNWDNAAPAGGVNASVYEVAQWMRMQLGEPGIYEGEQIVSRDQMREIHRPQVALPIGNPYGDQVSYGFGWRISDYNGYRTLSHGGATDGFNTSVTMLPELDLGIVVVTNTFNNFRSAVVNTIIDAYLDLPDTDWNEIYWNSYQNRYDYAMERHNEIEEARIEGTRPTHPLNDYTGLYVDDLYGMAEVTFDGVNLAVRFWGDDDLTADLEHWHHDTFRAVWRNPAQREEFLHFTLGQDGKVQRLNYQFTLRPVLLQVGAYPTDYYRVVEFEKAE